MDIEVLCPNCGRRNGYMVSRSQWNQKIYRKCMYCHQGFSSQTVVKKVKNIEAFLSKPKMPSNTSDINALKPDSDKGVGTDTV